MLTTTCCCCIPLRAGVAIIAFISFAFYAASTAILFVYKDSYFNMLDNRINGVNALFWTAVAISLTWLLTSLLGLVGIFSKTRPLVLIFSTFNWIMSFLSLGISMAVFILLLTKQQPFIDGCEQFWNEQGGPSSSPSPFHSSVNIPANQSSIQEYCQTALKDLVIATGVCTFVGNGIQLYFAAMVGAYSTRLKQLRRHMPLRDVEYMNDKLYMNPY